MLLLLIGMALGAGAGFFWGRVIESEYVVQYLQANEDKRVWWLWSGIACDEHWQRKWKHIAKQHYDDMADHDASA